MTLKFFVLLQLLLIHIPVLLGDLGEGSYVTLVGFQSPKMCGGVILTNRHFLTTVGCTYTNYNPNKKPSLVSGAYVSENIIYNSGNYVKEIVSREIFIHSMIL